MTEETPSGAGRPEEGDEQPTRRTPRHAAPDGASETPTPPAGQAASSDAIGTDGTARTPVGAGDTAETPETTPGTPGTPGTADSGADTDDAGEAPRRGRVRYQDPESTAPREPTVAEQRARREAQRRERAQREAAQAAEERKRTVRKRVLVGGGVAVGVVALVAIVYAASQPDETTAQCVDQNNVVQPDQNCPPDGQRGGYYDSGGHFVPIFLGGFGNQYHYNYGSSSPVGTRASGGSTAPPSSGTSLRSGTSGSSIGTSGGSSGTVSRGGLGVGGSSSSGGSSSGGSSSGS